MILSKGSDILRVYGGLFGNETVTMLGLTVIPGLIPMGLGSIRTTTVHDGSLMTIRPA